MEILKENQNIADTRTEAAIQKEALENDLNVAEKKAEKTKQDIEENDR